MKRLLLSLSVVVFICVSQTDCMGIAAGILGCNDNFSTCQAPLE